MDRLLKYFNNELSEQEDEKITRKLLEASQDHEYKERWERILEEKHNILPPHKHEEKPKRVHLLKKIAAVAASVLFLIFAGILYNQTPTPAIAQLNTEALVRSHLAEIYHYPNLKKGPRAEDFRAKATNAYAKNNYEEAIQYYDQISNLEGEDLVFKGLSYLYLNQPEKSIPLFETAIALLPFKGFRSGEEIKWHLCLAYLKNQEFEKAKTALQVLANNKKSKRQEDAEIILESLSNEMDTKK